MKIQSYKTLKSHYESEVKEKKSIFLAKAFPVSIENEVEKILSDLKKKYYDATHRCYAYRLISGKSKFADAGEPSGTAGIRILNAIDHFEIHDCLLVVIRYFGGTKLGVGPLGKAYYNAASDVLSKAEIITMKPHYMAELMASISSSERLLGFLYSNNIKIVETNYDLKVKIKCLIPVDDYESISKKITELLAGNLSIAVKDKILFK